MTRRKRSHLRRASLGLALLGGSWSGSGLDPAAAAGCPASIREVDLHAFLTRRHVPDPAECIFPPGPDGAVEMRSVAYADLDGRPGEEAVVRAQTCFMNTGGADISEVLALRCDGSSGPLVELPIDAAPAKSDPGQPRFTPRLEVEGGALVSSVLLFRPESSNQDPGWEKRVVYAFDGERFVVVSTTVRPL